MTTATEQLQQHRAKAAFDEASRQLAAASVRLREVQAEYLQAEDEYLKAYGAAKSSGVIA